LNDLPFISVVSRICLLIAATLVVAAVAGCERKTVVVEVRPATPLAEPGARTKTFETSQLGAAIDAYERRPTEEHRADVRKAFARLDGEIAELEALAGRRTGTSRDEAAAKLRNLQTYRAAETARFTALQAKVVAGVQTEGDARTGAEKVEDGAKRVGRTLEDAAKRAGEAVKDVDR
jgi:hypothetical protein